MAADRKRCRKCKRRRVINYFYTKTDSKDGYHSVCKDCYAATWGNKKQCNKCKRYLILSSFHKNKRSPDGRLYTCIACRVRKVDETAVVPKCMSCAFLAECRHNIRLKTFTPYCFVSSKYHGLYVKEYAGNGRRVAV